MSIFALLWSLITGGPALAGPGVEAPAATPSSLPCPPDALTPAPAPTAERPVVRLCGVEGQRAETVPEGFRFGRMKITTPLPEGYPAPTVPGAIELKLYPSVRRAQVRREGNADRRMNSAFWPLFRHIQRRDIEMTSPVEMDYEGMRADASGAPAAPPRAWTMSFLYRTPELGPLGADRGSVEVVDVPGMTVVSIGMRGEYSALNVRQQLAKLERWLSSSAEWEPVGAARALFYNGPEARRDNQWGEVQIPIGFKRRSAASEGAPEASSGSPEGEPPASSSP